MNLKVEGLLLIVGGDMEQKRSYQRLPLRNGRQVVSSD